MHRGALPVVVTMALLIGGAPIASAQSTTPTGTPYTPPGYSLTVPSAPQPVPVGTTVVAPQAGAPEMQTIRELWIPGLVGLPVSYVVTWVVGSVTLPTGSSAAELAYIPVLGPWLVLGEDHNGGAEFYATMGIVQGVSLVCLVLGLAIRVARPAADAPRVSFRPTSTGTMAWALQF